MRAIGNEAAPFRQDPGFNAEAVLAEQGCARAPQIPAEAVMICGLGSASLSGRKDALTSSATLPGASVIAAPSAGPDALAGTVLASR